MSELTYSVLDPWKAPRLGASGKKIWVAFKAIVCGYIAYLLLAYAAHMIAGTSPVTTWQVYHFFPLKPTVEMGLIPELLWWIGLVAAVLIVMIGATGLAKITYRQLKGDDFYGGSDAWRYALEHGRSTVSTPLILAVLFAFVCVALWVLGWISTIPTVGPILLGISAIPAFLAAFLGVYVLVVLLLSLLYTPAVIGTTGEDGLEGAIQMFSMLWSLPWRTGGYTAVVVVTTTVGTYLLAVISVGAVALVAAVVGGVLGPTFSDIATGVRVYLPPECTLLTDLPSWFWPGPLAALFPSIGLNPALTELPTGVAAVGAFLGGISMLVVLGLITAYALSSLTSGFTASYLALRRLKDGEMLLEWTDEVDELEEQLPPETDEPVVTEETEEVTSDKEPADDTSGGETAGSE